MEIRVYFHPESGKWAAEVHRSGYIVHVSAATLRQTAIRRAQSWMRQQKRPAGAPPPAGPTQ